ncbi:MAG: ATP-binding protein [Betaproteobacteria bacterium]
MNVYKAHQRLIPISDPSGVGEARRQIAALAASIQLEESPAGNLALAVTEAATNIVKHAREGTIAARIVTCNGMPGVEVLAIDKGAGISSVHASMRDGHSTMGSAGQGLGALSRVTSGLEIWSSPGGGTIMRFEVWPKTITAPADCSPVTGVVCQEMAGESACGDGWVVLEGRDRVVVFVGDGLGHGPEAAAAVHAAIAAVEKHADVDATTMMDIVHDALRATRGAAGAVAVLKPSSQQCEFCGVGNISAMIRADGTGHSMVSNNGTLGHRVRKLQPFQYAFPPNALFIAHSDGIATHWNLASYPGLESRHPAVVAATLFRDHSRGPA